MGHLRCAKKKGDSRVRHSIRAAVGEEEEERERDKRAIEHDMEELWRRAGKGEKVSEKWLWRIGDVIAIP
jgi:hypothetical protein